MSDLPVELPNGCCPLCGGTIGAVRRVGHWHDRVHGSGWWYSGRCAGCDVDFRLEVRRRTPGALRLVAPEASELVSMLAAREIEILSERLRRNKIHGERWKSLLARCRAGDELWRYSTSAGCHGIAQVRAGRPVAQFQATEGLVSAPR